MSTLGLPPMDESISLDDDGILSPDMEDPAQRSPLMQLDTPEPPLQVTDSADSGKEPDADGETEKILEEAKSMENILLETSPTMESLNLGSDSMLTASSMLSEDIDKLTTSVTDGLEQAVQDAGGDGKPQEEEEAAFFLTAEENREITQEETKEAPVADTGPNLSSYFGEPKEPTNEASFFDNLREASVAPTEDATTSPETPEPPAAAVAMGFESPPQKEEVIRERTLSVASEEATPVSFEEVKGTGMKFVGSMESVTKFFSDVNAAGTEGKSFFDSFTAGDDDSDLNKQQSPSSQPDSLTNTSSQPVAIPGSVPPETPPIPHEPMSMSPLPSPIHSTFMRQRSISQSQASPTPSPIHLTLTGTSAPESMSQPLDPALMAGQEGYDPATHLHPSFPSGDDLFTSSLSMSDADRRHDAWIPSEVTRQTLVAMVTSPPGAFVPEEEQLTAPGVMLSEPLGDPVQELVQRFMGEAEASKRITLTIEDVPQNPDGVRKLISAECWRSAIDLTGRLLEAYDQGSGKLGHPSKHSVESLQLWFCRIALFIKLRLYTHAENECQAFGNLDRPDLYYEYYPEVYPGRRGSMVPFAFRVLHAELSQYIGKTQESLDRLYYVHAITRKIIANLESGLAEDGSMLQLTDDSRNASRELWETREVQLLYSIGNCLLSNKDYAMAVLIFEILLKKDTKPPQGALECSLGRIYLQMGDVKAAQRYFALAESSADTSIPDIRCRNFMNKGFIALGQNQFAEAQNYFKQAMVLKPTNAVAVNNMAVCSLYMGRLKDALSTLESLVHEDPGRYLQEGILFNLCTLYELESSRALHKKQALLQLVSKHKGNGFNVACLKMT